jgi:hypothetical protein
METRQIDIAYDAKVTSLALLDFERSPPRDKRGEFRFQVKNSRVGQLFLGMPFVGSIVYAITSVVVRWDDHHKRK